MRWKCDGVIEEDGTTVGDVDYLNVVETLGINVGDVDGETLEQTPLHTRVR